MSYRDDRAWGDLWLPHAKQIIGPLLLEEAPERIDMEEATDLIILAARDMRVAVRVRRPEYYAKYPWDITIRSKRVSGSATEFAKLLNGYGDWYFYGHAADYYGRKLRRWFIVDLDVWRAYASTHPIPSDIPTPGGTWMKAYSLRHLYHFDRSAIVASDVTVRNGLTSWRQVHTLS